MKYNFLKREKIRRFDIPKLQLGLNLTDEENRIDDRQLTTAENVWFRNGELKTRAGFCASQENIIKTQMPDSIGRHNFYLTDTYFYYLGEKRRIVTEKFYYNLSHMFVCVYLLGSDLSTLPIGYLLFSRVDERTFYTPENITFYVGDSVNGGGIFAFVSLVNEATYVGREKRIYEINSTFDGWERSTEYYIPTVYINGRGNAYEEAVKAINFNIVGKPRELESPNLLTNCFYAYYTTDGHSHSFRLPFVNIANEPVICEISSSPFGSTKWNIPADGDSATASFMTYEVTAHIDRNIGLVYFTVASGNFLIPRINMCGENNLRIMASRKDENHFDDVVSSKHSATIGSRIVFSGSNEKNRLYYARYDNPLYFPYDSDCVIGSSDSPVTALFSVDDKVLAFKDSEIYSITNKKGEALNQTALLEKDDSIFYKNDTFTIKCLNKKIGCNNPLSISSYKNNPFWLGADNNIYSISTSGNITELSHLITPYLAEFSQFKLKYAFSLCTGDKYFLVLEKEIILLNFNDSTSKEKVSIYFWNLPKDFCFCGGVANDTDICFLIENTEDNCFFTATLSGDRDLLISQDNVCEYDIKSKIATKHFFFGGLRNSIKLKSVYLNLNFKGNINLTLFSKDNHYDSFNLNSKNLIFNDNVIKLIPKIKNVSYLQLKLESDKSFSLGDGVIFYTAQTK